MYKFEISADSPQELREKMMEFAAEISSQNEPEPVSEYIDEVPTFVEPMSFPIEVVVVEEEEPTPGPKDTPTVDSAGVIYDRKIHSSSRNVTSDGTWRSKRTTKNVQPEVVQAPPMVIPPAPVAAVQVEVPTFVQPVVVVEKPVQKPKYEEIPIPAGTRPAYDLASFTNNLNLIFANLIHEGKIDRPYVESLKKHFEVKEIWNITADGKKTAELYDLFGKYGLITAMG